MKIFSILLIGLVACTATAEVIVYHQKINQTKSGNGSVEKIALVGFTVTDTDGHVSFINADPNRRRFSVTEGNHTIVGGVAIGGEKEVGAIVVGYKTGVGALVCKGKNVPTPVSPALTLNTPKTLKVTGGGLSVTNGQNYLDDFKGALVYNATDTTDFNVRSLSKDNAVVELTARFIGQGFTEE